MKTRRDERGSMMLDVLLSMTLTILLAVIAAGSFSAYHARDIRISAETDVQRVTSALLSDGASYRTYPASLSSTATELAGVRLTEGNFVRGYERAADARGFTVCVVNASSGAWAIATSRNGVTSSSTGGIPDACSTGGDVDTAYYR